MRPSPLVQSRTLAGQRLDGVEAGPSSVTSIESSPLFMTALISTSRGAVLRGVVDHLREGSRDARAGRGRHLAADAPRDHLAGDVLGGVRARVHQDAELLALVFLPLGLDGAHERVGQERTLEDEVGARGRGAVEVLARAVGAGDEDDQRVALQVTEGIDEREAVESVAGATDLGDDDVGRTAEDGVLDGARDATHVGAGLDHACEGLGDRLVAQGEEDVTRRRRGGAGAIGHAATSGVGAGMFSGRLMMAQRCAPATRRATAPPRRSTSRTRRSSAREVLASPSARSAASSVSSGVSTRLKWEPGRRRRGRGP